MPWQNGWVNPLVVNIHAAPPPPLRPILRHRRPRNLPGLHQTNLLRAAPVFASGEASSARPPAARRRTPGTAMFARGGTLRLALGLAAVTSLMTPVNSQVSVHSLSACTLPRRTAARPTTTS